MNKKLKSILLTETASLKTQYIALTKEFAAADFLRITEVANAPFAKYEDFATPGFVKGTGFAAIDYEQGKKYQKAGELRYRANEIVSKGFEAFEAKLIKLAEQHYEDSIAKLAFRIEKKELDIDNLSVVTSHIGQNIETTLTDGSKSVRAFTIIASGPIQKPHYRYLVK